jgi:hypothetical protein
MPRYLWMIARLWTTRNLIMLAYRSISGMDPWIFQTGGGHSADSSSQSPRFSDGERKRSIAK